MRSQFLFYLLLLQAPFLAIGQNSNLEEFRRLNNLAFAFLDKDDLDSACYYGQKALELGTSNNIENARTNFIIGVCLSREKVMDSAFLLLERVKLVFEENEMIPELALTYWYLGKVWNGLNQLEKAKNFYLQAGQFFREVDNYEMQLKVFNNLAVLEFIKGRYKEGLDYLTRALEFIETHGFRDASFKVYNNISVAYSKLKEFDMALKFSDKSLAIGDTSVNKEILVQALYNRAGLFKSMPNPNPDSVEHYYNLSIEFAKKFDVDQSSIYRLLGIYYYENNEYDKAISNMQKAIKGNSSPLDIMAHYNLGKYYFETGILDSANYFANKTFEQSSNNGYVEYSYRSAKLLSDISLVEKNYQKSLEYLSIYNELRDSIYNIQAQEQLSDMRVQIETMDKVNEIERLKAQAEIDELQKLNILRVSIALGLILILSIVMIILWFRNRRRQQQLEQLDLQKRAEQNALELQQQTLHMIDLNNKLQGIQESLAYLKANEQITHKDLQRVVNTINVNKTMEDDWKRFETYFSNLHEKFSGNLNKNHHNLTLQDRRLAALIKMELSNREISSIMNVESRTVIVARHRLKKRLGLEEGVNLEHYIRSL